MKQSQQSILRPLLAVGALFYLLGQVPAWSEFADISVGMSTETVKSMLGPPLGRVKGHGGVILIYQEGGVELHDDAVVKIDPKLGRNAMNTRRAAKTPPAHHDR